jgi:ornithine--oxo-acid transaminase
MNVFQPGTHGSTFGGNPLGAHVAITSLKVIVRKNSTRRKYAHVFNIQVLIDEGMIENAARMGELLRHELNQLPKEIVKVVRGKGLLNAIVIDERKLSNEYCWSDSFDRCIRLRCMGTLSAVT